MKIFNVLKLFLISFLFSINAFSMQPRALASRSGYDSDNEIEDKVAFFPSEEEVQNLRESVFSDLQRNSRLVFTTHLKTQILLTTFIAMGIGFDMELDYCFESSFKDKRMDRLLSSPKARILFLCSDVDRIIKAANDQDDPEKIKYFKVLQESFSDLFDAGHILNNLTYNEDFLEMFFPNVNNVEELRSCSYTLLSSNIACLFHLFDLVKDYSLEQFKKRRDFNLKISNYISRNMKFVFDYETINNLVFFIEKNREATFLEIYKGVYRYVYEGLLKDKIQARHF